MSHTNFYDLDTIELKEGFFAQYFAGRDIYVHPDELSFRVRFNSGIPAGAAFWCAENCKERWGWLHVNVDPHKTIPHCEESYLLFESEDDAILFKLTWKF